MVQALDEEGRPVIVHCSDGWDRTPQIVSIAQMLLDPYYRTIDGFQTLIEKDWLDYGHKMADRCGNPMATADVNERSPIFLQWLDCVHQLLRQFPCHFEFNASFLVKLATHVYSQLYGTFLGNSQLERQNAKVKETTISGNIWLSIDEIDYPGLTALSPSLAACSLRFPEESPGKVQKLPPYEGGPSPSAKVRAQHPPRLERSVSVSQTPN